MNSTTYINLEEVVIRVARADELARVGSELDQRHYLGRVRPVGDTLVQIAEAGGRWVAILAWGAAAKRLKDREAWIGWDARTRAGRLKLVVNQHRFAILVEGVPNLASRVLSVATKGLAEQWEATHGYRPVLAETFVDVERFAGTCYRAAGWEVLGLTAGNRRIGADYYVPNDRPKQLWIKPLVKAARARLGAEQLRAAQADGATPAPVGVLPVRQPQLESLYAAFQRVPDPRSRNRRHRCDTVLTIVALGLLMGQSRVMDFVRLATQLNRRQRELLGYYRRPGQKIGQAPGKDVFYLLLRAIDSHQLAAVLNAWLATQHGQLPANLALDGKVVGDRLALIVSLVDAQTGAPVAQAVADDPIGGEIEAGRRRLATTELTETVITADAGHANHETARTIVMEAQADYLIQIKGNTAAVREAVAKALENTPPLLPTRNPAMAGSKRGN